MLTIPFTQFFMPDGRQEEVFTELPDDDGKLAEKLKAIQAAGCRLTIELLSDYKTISMCVEEPNLGDFLIKLTPNGPTVPGTVRALLLEFDPQEFKAWKKSEEE